MKKKILLVFLLMILFCILLNAEVDIDPQAVAERTTVGNIVLAGMLIVFMSLIIVAVVISLFKHLHKNRGEEKKDEDATLTRKISTVSQISGKSPATPPDHKLLTAIITTIFLHENEVENQSKMLLTMKRAKMSQWKQASKNQMPNESFGNIHTLKLSKPVEKN